MKINSLSSASLAFAAFLSLSVKLPLLRGATHPMRRVHVPSVTLSTPLSVVRVMTLRKRSD
jgi:hypothetical protein